MSISNENNANLFNAKSLSTGMGISVPFRFALGITGPILAILTALLLLSVERLGNLDWLRFILLLDLVYVMVLAALVIQMIVRIYVARKNRSAGSRLHVRLSSVFAFVALIPAVLVAVFATITVNFGLESWFSTSVRSVVDSSFEAAQAYSSEHRETLSEDTLLLAAFLNREKTNQLDLDPAKLRDLLNVGQSTFIRKLERAYIIDGKANIITRGERSYLFDFIPFDMAILPSILTNKPYIIEDHTANEFRALLPLRAFDGHFLYVTREVDGKLLSLLDETEQTVLQYRAVEGNKDQMLYQFALIYLGFALLVILGAIWVGLWFAERISQPVGQLVGAVERVRDGDLEVQVVEQQGDDEIAILSRAFNQMTEQVKTQHDELIETNIQTDIRSRLFDSVLSGVSAGVIGTNSLGQIDVVNNAARDLLGIDPKQAMGMQLLDVVPEFKAIFTKVRDGQTGIRETEVQVVRDGNYESLLVSISKRIGDDKQIEGYVVSFDDVTDLVSAQRMAAWGDVARRIAHEIKNPLTPIKLSAERIKRKFGPKLGEDQALLDQYTDVIVRQTDDLRHIVDEFSQFARMPKPQKTDIDLRKLLNDAILLQEPALPTVKLTNNIGDNTQMIAADGTMISQAVVNLIKNSGEAIESYLEKVPANATKEYQPEIQVELVSDPKSYIILIKDNGIGLPEHRSRLFEPYVTNRDSGTGLGLSIVKKIIEEHNGSLELVDAPLFNGCDHMGAMAIVKLPRTNTLENKLSE